MQLAAEPTILSNHTWVLWIVFATAAAVSDGEPQEAEVDHNSPPGSAVHVTTSPDIVRWIIVTSACAVVVSIGCALASWTLRGRATLRHDVGKPTNVSKRSRQSADEASETYITTTSTQVMESSSLPTQAPQITKLPVQGRGHLESISKGESTPTSDASTMDTTTSVKHSTEDSRDSNAGVFKNGNDDRV